MLAYKVVKVKEDDNGNRILTSVCVGPKLSCVYMKNGITKTVRSGFCFETMSDAINFHYNHSNTEVWECEVATSRFQNHVLAAWDEIDLPSKKAIAKFLRKDHHNNIVTIEGKQYTRYWAPWGTLYCTNIKLTKKVFN
jgi:hypothetical protein